MDITRQQAAYWDRAAADKTFTHPLQLEFFSRLVPKSSRILDVGCGYGRICAELRQRHYTDLVGIDISAAMIERGRALHPELDLRHVPEQVLPFADASFDACLLFAVLNCIPEDSAQHRLVAEIVRLLRPGGVLYLSDYLLQSDSRNLDRYARYCDKYGRYGVFEIDDGTAVMRHHDLQWLGKLLQPFRRVWQSRLTVTTMNGNPARAIQIMVRKKTRP